MTHTHTRSEGLKNRQFGLMWDECGGLRRGRMDHESSYISLRVTWIHSLKLRCQRPMLRGRRCVRTPCLTSGAKSKLFDFPIHYFFNIQAPVGRMYWFQPHSYAYLGVCGGGGPWGPLTQPPPPEFMLNLHWGAAFYSSSFVLTAVGNRSNISCRQPT